MEKKEHTLQDCLCRMQLQDFPSHWKRFFDSFNDNEEHKFIVTVTFLKVVHEDEEFPSVSVKLSSKLRSMLKINVKVSDIRSIGKFFVK